MQLSTCACFIALLLSVLHCTAAKNDDPVGRVNDDGDGIAATLKEHLNDDAAMGQQAFLGKSRVKEFEELPPDEARERLKKIIGLIDTNKDEVVSVRELAEWIKGVDDNYYIKDSNREFDKLDGDKDGYVTFDEYAKSLGLDGDLSFHEDVTKYDRVKFKAADEDGDEKLNKEEFPFYMYPEQHKFMAKHVVTEFLEHHDEDNDGSISFKEYTDVYHPHLSAGAGEPRWLKEEQDNFRSKLDKDGDGKLDKDELTHWIIPDDGMFAIEEAEYLMSEADVDKDQQLSELEILDNYEVFVNSRVSHPFMRDEL